MKSGDRELVIERVFNAPRELVFKAFTEPEHLKHWWGPQGWTLPVCNLDLRPGGVWHYCMRGPEGEESWGKSIYQEIVPPERLVYLDAFSDADGNAVPNMPQMRITNLFAADGNGSKTRLTSSVQFATDADLEAVMAMGVVDGIGSTWDRLDLYLANA